MENAHEFYDPMDEEMFPGDDMDMDNLEKVKLKRW